MFQTVDDDNAVLGHELGLNGVGSDGIPFAYPLGLGYGDSWDRPSGNAQATWAKHGGVDPSALIWRKAQVNRAKRAGWVRQPDGSYVPQAKRRKDGSYLLPTYINPNDGPVEYPKMMMGGCGDGLPDEYCEGVGMQSGGLGGMGGMSYSSLATIGIVALAGAGAGFMLNGTRKSALIGAAACGAYMALKSRGF